MNSTPLALVTGASSGIGYELAAQCARHGLDLVIAADQPLQQATNNLEHMGVQVQAVQADLATPDGVAQLYESLSGVSVTCLMPGATETPGTAKQ